jgi:hypothetical protein
MGSRLIRIFMQALLLCALSSMVCQGGGPTEQKERSEGMRTVTGTLQRVAAIGGETTGWAVDLDSALAIGGEELKQIEVDPGDNKIDTLDGKRVEIVGQLKKRQGVERKDYWVIAADKIREICGK